MNLTLVERPKIICVDDEYLKVEGMGNVKVKWKNGKNVLIKDVWYVLGMNNNLMSVGQLLEKGFLVPRRKIS